MDLWTILKHLYAQQSTGFHDRFTGSLEDQNTQVRTQARRAGVRPWDIYSDSEAYSPQVLNRGLMGLFADGMKQGEIGTRAAVQHGPLSGQDLDNIMQNIFREQQEGLRTKKNML